MKLDAKTVAALTLDGKTDVIYFDDELPGYGYRLRQGAHGKVLRSYIAQYRHAGSQRRMLLGSAAVLGEGQARAAAKKVLAKAVLGEDPSRAKAERRGKDRSTLGRLLDEYLAIKQSEVRPRTFVEIRRYLTVNFKALHSIPIDAVTRKDIAAQVVAMTRQRGTQAAILARATLSAFFSWAMTMGLVEANPVIGAAQPKATPSRDRVLTDDELVRIWNACQDDDHGRIIRLLVLTGCRRAEVGGMCWSEIDLERELWTIPSARAKNSRSHTLPLMPVARDIIASVPHMATRDHLFGARGAAGFTTWALRKAELDERSGVIDWTVHDIRRSVATKMSDIGVQPHIVEQVLNHQSGHRHGVAGVYNRSVYEREVRAALAAWSDHVRTLVEGARARKVVTLRAN